MVLRDVTPGRVRGVAVVVGVRKGLDLGLAASIGTPRISGPGGGIRSGDWLCRNATVVC
jgi:hypothetical protein